MAERWWAELLLSTDKPWSRRRVLVYETAVLCALWTFAGLHLTGVLVLPKKFGSLPIGVPFFGALGAVLISLSAVFDFRGAGWDPGWEAWHYTRWLVGGTLGIISVLIFQAGILSVGLDLSAPTKGPKNLAYYLIAFVVGYREATFRELIKRLVDVILTPGAGIPPVVGSLNPSSGPRSGGTSVAITGKNLARVSSVSFGGVAATIVDQGSDTYLVAETPAAQSAGAVPVVVETPDGSDATQTFTYL
jgi:hypothetical protein